MAEQIISLVIFGLVALIMIGIGFSQFKSKNPVGFYSGEKAPSADEIKDVKAWNRKHGMMWLVYGIIIIISWGIGSLIGDSLLCLIPFLGGLIVPVIFMIWYHHRLIQLYKR